MSDQDFKEIICEKLGELMYEYENSFDWGKQIELQRKIDSCNILLDQPVITTKNKLQWIL